MLKGFQNIIKNDFELKQLKILKKLIKKYEVIKNIKMNNREFLILFNLEETILKGKDYLKDYRFTDVSLYEILNVIQKVNNIKKSKNVEEIFNLINKIIIFPKIRKNPILYSSYAWVRSKNKYVRRRFIFEPMNSKFIRIYDENTVEDNLLKKASKLDNGKNLVIELILENDENEDVFNVLEKMINNEDLYIPNFNEENYFLKKNNNIVPKKNKTIKELNQFEDLLLIMNTQQIDKINSTEYLIDNPILVLPIIAKRIWNLIDGIKDLNFIFKEIEALYGDKITIEYLESMIYHLMSIGFLKVENSDKLEYIKNVSIKEWDYDISIIQKSFRYTELPIYVLIEPTDQCNRECKGCYKNYCKLGYKRDLPDGVFLEKVLKPIIKENIPNVTILGGEPLLRKELTLELINRLRVNNVYTKLITNGDYITKEIAKLLGKLGLNKIELSLDGFEKETTDYLRGEGNLEKVKVALKNLDGTDIPEVGLSITVSSFNFEEIYSGLEAFLNEHSIINKVYFSRFYKNENIAYEKEIEELTAKQIQKLEDKIKYLKRKINRDRFEMAILDTGGCSCGRSMAIINSEGFIKPCPFIEETGANIINYDSFYELWEKSFNPLREFPKTTCFSRGAWEDYGIKKELKRMDKLI